MTVPSEISETAVSPNLLQESGRDAWLLEEYKLLNLHYFHEDDFFLKCAAHFTTINTGIVTIYGSKSWFNLDDFVVAVIPVIGLVATVTWVLTLLRVRHVKLGIENRISDLEESINKFWKLQNVSPAVDSLRIRYSRKKGGGVNRISSTFIMTLLPLTFATIWSALLYHNASDIVRWVVSFL